jgi:gliding motility-associated-like protein
MRHFFLYIIFIFFQFTLSAQDNLVPNYSFETYSACPTSADQFNFATNWYTCNKESPDYYNACQLIPHTYGIPFTIHGYQPARTGDAFTGIYVYGNLPATRREYVQVQLTSTLKADTDYDIAFYVNLANDATIAISQLGAYLSNSAISDTTSGALPYTPQIVSATGIFFTDTTKWVKVSGNFRANGGEKFITIGNFKDELSTDTLQLSALPALAYYFIDDISITQSDSTAEPANVFTPNDDGLNDDWIIRNLPKNSQVKIYNRWGVMVGGVDVPGGIQGTFKWDGRTTSGERCISGVYYYVITTDKTRNGFIQLVR